MTILIIVMLIILGIVWALASISTSLAAAKQAEATIKAAQVAQTASAGNLITIIVFALLVIAILTIAGYLLSRYLRLRFGTLTHGQRANQWLSSLNADWRKIPSSASASLLQSMNDLLILKIMEALITQQWKDSIPPLQESILPNATEQDDDDNSWPPGMWTN